MVDGFIQAKQQQQQGSVRKVMEKSVISANSLSSPPK